MTTPTLHQNVLFKLFSRLHPATVVHVVDEDTVHLAVESDGINPWDDGASTSAFEYPVRIYTFAARGTGIGEWQESAMPDIEVEAIDDAITAAVEDLPSSADVDSAIATAVTGLATSSSVSSAIATAVAPLATSSGVTSAIATAVTGLASNSGVTSAIATAVTGLATETYCDTAVAGRCVIAGAGSAQTLALNTPRQPSTTRPTRVTVSGSWSWTLSATGTVTATATFVSDANSTPTMTRAVKPFSRGIGVGLSVNDTGTVPWEATYDVPAGHYYAINTTGTGIAIVHINETAG